MATARRAFTEATTHISTETEIDVERVPGEALGDVDIAAVAALMADSSRAAVLIELIDGRALPPSELAEVAGVSRSTISEHLVKLERAGFLTVEQGARNRYFRLVGPEISTAVESLAAPAPRFPVRSLKQSTCAGALGDARTCYGHLAGRLGVVLTDACLGSAGCSAPRGRSRFEPRPRDLTESRLCLEASQVLRV